MEIYAFWSEALGKDTSPAQMPRMFNLNLIVTKQLDSCGTFNKIKALDSSKSSIWKVKVGNKTKGIW